MNPGCPDAEALRALLDDDADEGRSDYSDHLETCTCCQQTLAELAADGSTWQEAVRFLPAVEANEANRTSNSEQILKRGVDQLKTELPLLLGMAAPESVGDVCLKFLQPTDQPGVLGLLGAYEVLQVIGQGGMGIVLKAFDPTLKRFVAIKVPTPVLAGNTNARRRFIREAQTAAAVSHVHVVPVHGVFEADGLPYLVMKFIEGESLQARLDRAGPFPIEEIIEIGEQTARGLVAAHAQGLIHRDIKPANVLLETKSGGQGLADEANQAEATGSGETLAALSAHVWITDFGLARMTDDVPLTLNGVLTGTPEYMAPEQARGEPLDHRADLFSLGSVLYALCTGVPPFRGSTPLGVLLKVSNEDPKPIRELNPNVPVWMEAFITRLLAKEPAQRPQNAVEVASLLEAYQASLLAPLTISAPELPHVASSRDPGLTANLCRRVVPWIGLAAVLILALLATWLIGGFGAGPIEDDTNPNTGLREVFAYDFRGKPIPDNMAFFGDQQGQFLKSEPEGLRITIPNTFLHPWGGVGVNTTLPIEGDFEITATVDILHTDRPAKGNGVGLSLGISKFEPAVEGGAILRVRKVDDAEVVGWDRIIDTPDQRWGQYILGNTKPCSDKVGRMRLKRTGATLFYQWAPGLAGENFDTIHEITDFGTGPIRAARVAAFTGRQPCVVDVLLIDLRVRTGIASVPRKGGLALAVFGALILGVVLAGSLILLLRLRSAKQPALSSGEKRSTSQPALAISFPCAACRKSLKARAALAGKKVKCVRCGRPVLVPAS